MQAPPNSNVTSQSAVVKSKGFGTIGTVRECLIRRECFSANNFNGTMVYRFPLLGASPVYYAFVEETSVTLRIQDPKTTSSLEGILDSIVNSPFAYESCVSDGTLLGFIHRGSDGTVYCISFENPFHCISVLRSDDGRAIRFARVIDDLLHEARKKGNRRECSATSGTPPKN